MATNGMATLLEDEKMTAALIGTARDIEKRVDLNLRRLHVGEYNPRRPNRRSGKTERLPGTMHRSIYWQVFNATGGDEYKIKFWMEAVANYVELAVQGNGPGIKGKNGKFMSHKTAPWRVKNGGLPELIKGTNYKSIRVDRVNTEGKTLKRRAKPFIGGELRVHGRMLFDRLLKDYSYVGNVIMASAIDVRKILPYFDKNDKNTAKKEWSGNVRTMKEILSEMAFNRNTDVAALTHQGWNPIAGSGDASDWEDLRLNSDRH